jgi:hypothetical protein
MKNRHQCPKFSSRLISLGAALIATAACRGEQGAISEASLLEYASTPYKKGAHGADHQVLGKMNDVDVVVDFMCSDVCPDYTVRVIHFDVDPGPKCDEIGGVEQSVVVPVAIAAMPKLFCFPRVLTTNWDAYVR